MARKRYDSRKATPAEVEKAVTEAEKLFQELYPRNLLGAARYVRDNPPNTEALAMYPYVVHKILTSAIAAKGGKWRPEDSLVKAVEDLDLRSLSDARKKAPELLTEIGEQRMCEAISRHKKKIGQPATRNSQHKGHAAETKHLQRILQNTWK